MFDCMTAYMTAASQVRISFLWKPEACTNRTPICGSSGPRVAWYLDHTPMNFFVQADENGLSLSVWQPT